jgi:metal-responsive CopG/Arc/MetJ family transcriptional regulator
LRVRIRILLTEDEIRKLDSAVDESGAMNRSLLVSSAIQSGLMKNSIRTLQRNIKRREVPIWVTAEQKNKVRTLAKANQLSQQSLLRHFLHEYLTASPWERTENGSDEADSCD